MIGMANFAANEYQRAATLRHPPQVAQLRLMAQQPAMLGRRQSLRMLRADVDHLAALPHQLVAHMRLAAAACNRLVAEDQPFINRRPIRRRHEEPLTLADESLVASPVALSRLDLQLVLAMSDGDRFQRFKRRLELWPLLARRAQVNQLQRLTSLVLRLGQ